MRLGEKVSPRRGAAIGRGTAMTACGSWGVAALAPPLEQDLVGVEPEVERVVAQEALGVDGAGELAIVAALERGEVAGADLRVPLRAVQVDALALASGEEALGEAGCGVGWPARAYHALRPEPRAGPDPVVVTRRPVLLVLLGSVPATRRRAARATVRRTGYRRPSAGRPEDVRACSVARIVDVVLGTEPVVGAVDLARRGRDCADPAAR